MSRLHAGGHAAQRMGHPALSTTPPGGAPLVQRGTAEVTSVAELYQRQAGPQRVMFGLGLGLGGARTRGTCLIVRAPKPSTSLSTIAYPTIYLYLSTRPTQPSTYYYPPGPTQPSTYYYPQALMSSAYRQWSTERAPGGVPSDGKLGVAPGNAPGGVAIGVAP
eukprot:scaffold1168_cov87-Phaeocystis_antarctica.AAC.1